MGIPSAESLYYLKFGSKGRMYYIESFEKEAYNNEKDLNYIQNRKIFAQWRKVGK